MKYKSWTEEENNILKQLYSTTKLEELVKMLPGRSADAIKIHAQHLGVYSKVKYKSWGEDELEILKTHYPTEGKRVMYRLPGRSLKNIQVTAHRLGIHKKGRVHHDSTVTV